MTNSETSVWVTAIGGSIVALAGIIYDSIQIIGVAAVISIIMTTSKFYFDRQENRRRKRQEGVQRLQPNIYGPLLTWAVGAKKRLSEYEDDDIYNHMGQSLPSLDDEPDYIAIVGETLKKNINKITNIYNNYYEINEQVKKEYHDRIKLLISKLEKGWTYDSTKIITRERGTLDIIRALDQYRMKTIREYLISPTPIILKHNSHPHQEIECPKEIIDAMQHTKNLPTFTKFKDAQKELDLKLDPFVSEITNIIRNGENDWKI